MMDVSFSLKFFYSLKYVKAKFATSSCKIISLAEKYNILFLYIDYSYKKLIEILN